MKTEAEVETLKRSKRIFVESLDGESYGGDTPSEIVAAMRKQDWGGGMQSDGIRGYMKQVAKRVWDWSNKRIRINTPENFLKDMEKEGIVRVTRQGEDK